ncbi:MAG: hypothetical protein AAGD05_08060 [Bacteroidota bacterium]
MIQKIYFRYLIFALLKMGLLLGGLWFLEANWAWANWLNTKLNRMVLGLIFWIFLTPPAFLLGWLGGKWCDRIQEQLLQQFKQGKRLQSSRLGLYLLALSLLTALEIHLILKYFTFDIGFNFGVPIWGSILIYFLFVVLCGAGLYWLARGLARMV